LHLQLDLLRRATGESIPTSRIASITFGQIASAGACPADSARRSGGAYRSKNACAIWLRPALCVQTKST